MVKDYDDNEEDNEKDDELDPYDVHYDDKIKAKKDKPRGSDYDVAYENEADKKARHLEEDLRTRDRKKQDQLLAEAEAALRKQKEDEAGPGQEVYITKAEVLAKAKQLANAVNTQSNAAPAAQISRTSNYERPSKQMPPAASKPVQSVAASSVTLEDDQLKQLKKLLEQRFTKYLTNKSLIKVHKDRATQIITAINGAKSLDVINAIIQNQMAVLQGQAAPHSPYPEVKILLTERFATGAKNKIANPLAKFCSGMWKALTESQERIIPNFVSNQPKERMTPTPSNK